jgi:hypothetical protein
MKKRCLALVLLALVSTTTLSSCFWGYRGGWGWHHGGGWHHHY